MAAFAPGKKLLHLDSRAFEDGKHNSLAVFQQGGKQMHGQDFGVAVFRSQRRGRLNGLLRLDGHFFPFEWHISSNLLRKSAND